MAEGSIKRRRKRNISQEDIYPVLQRYPVTTVLTLLKEVAQVADKIFDWNELVKKTATGISSAREYQMLWRHLAYQDALEQKIEEGDVPMDDDSDIEFELEAYPPVSSDASIEAVACAKVLLSSASLTDGNPSSTVEAPFSITIPSGWSSISAIAKPQLQETTVTVPVLVPKQSVSLPTVGSFEGLDAMEASGGNLPPRRRRKPWSKEEDEELIAAVQRNGEGNWANILKGEFKGDRTPSQLSQRWAIIKKQKKNSNVGVSSLTADFSAVRKAFNMALDMPMTDSKPILLNGKGGSSSNTITAPSNSSRPTVGESLQSQYPHRQDFDPTSSSKSRFMKPSSTSPNLSTDAMVKAAAVAAGARIATPSDAATLLKAAQWKNAVHIIPSGPSSAKPCGPSSAKSCGPSIVNSLPPNVHFLGRGRSTSGSNNNVVTNASRNGAPQAQNQISRSSLPTAQINLTKSANESNFSRKKVQEEFNVVSQNIKVENPRCLSPSKVVVETNLTSIGAGRGSGVSGEKNIIEIKVEREIENKSTAEMEKKMAGMIVDEGKGKLNVENTRPDGKETSDDKESVKRIKLH